VIRVQVDVLFVSLGLKKADVIFQQFGGFLGFRDPAIRSIEPTDDFCRN
jgi:hypothetical protein